MQQLHTLVQRHGRPPLRSTRSAASPTHGGSVGPRTAPSAQAVSAGHGAVLGPRDELGVLGQHAGRVAGLRVLQSAAPLRQHVLVDLEVDAPRRNVQHDAVAVGDEPDRAAVDGLRA